MRERAGNLVGSANIDDRLTLNGPTVIALVHDKLASRKMEEAFTSDTLMKELQAGCGRKSDLRGRIRRYTNQLMMDTIGLPTLRWTMRGGARKYGAILFPRTSTLPPSITK